MGSRSRTTHRFCEWCRHAAARQFARHRIRWRSGSRRSGVTPKRLARTRRTATVFSINPAGAIDGADLASGAGYFDHAHFGHEFREFTGLTPTRYVEVRQRFLCEHPGHTLDGWPLPAD